MLCLGHGKFYESCDPSLCPAHLKDVNQKLGELLAFFGGKFTSMVATIIKLGAEHKSLSPHELNEILTTKLNWAMPALLKAPSKSRFNSTQALKRFCREKFKEDPSSKTSKPPKNSQPKSEFVAWARSNNIDISQFKTRAYKKKRDACHSFSRDANDDDSPSFDEESSASSPCPPSDDSHMLVSSPTSTLLLFNNNDKSPICIDESHVTAVSHAQTDVIAQTLPAAPFVKKPCNEYEEDAISILLNLGQ